MELFSDLINGTSRLLGKIDLEEHRNGNIYIYNIPKLYESLLTYSKKVLRSNRFFVGMFGKSGRSTIIFPSFFLIEFVYILECMKRDTQTTYLNQRYIRKILELLEENTWYKKLLYDQGTCTNLNGLNNLKWTTFPDQKEYIINYGVKVNRLNLRGFILPGKVGSGKTFTSLALAECLPIEKTKIKIIVVLGKTLRSVWEETVNSIYKRTPKIWTSYDKTPPTIGCEFYIVHYEALSIIVEFAKLLYKRNISFFTIIDECHHFNEIKSQRTQKIIELCNIQKDGYSVWASGTPIKHMGLEVIPVMKSITNDFTPYVEECFKKMFGGAANNEIMTILSNRIDLITHKLPDVKVVESPPIISQLKISLIDGELYTSKVIGEKIKEFVIQRIQYYDTILVSTRNEFDVLIQKYAVILQKKDLKKFLNYRQQIDVLKTSRYNKIPRDKMILYLKETKEYETTVLLPVMNNVDSKRFKEIRSLIKSFSLKILGEAIGTIITGARSELSSKLARNCELNNIIDAAAGKTLIFTSYINAVKAAEDQLKNLFYVPVCIFAETSKIADVILKEFSANEEINPLIATFASLSTGVPITEANVMIMLDIPSREYLYNQAVGRIARRGQTRQTYVYEVLLDTGTEPNLSTRMKHILEESKEHVAILMGDELSEDINIDLTPTVKNEITSIDKLTQSLLGFKDL